MGLYRQVGTVPAQKTQVRLEFFVSLGRGVFNEFRRKGCSRKHLTRGLPLPFKGLLQTICLESARTLLSNWLWRSCLLSRLQHSPGRQKPILVFGCPVSWHPETDVLYIWQWQHLTSHIRPGLLLLTVLDVKCWVHAASGWQPDEQVPINCASL